MMFLLHNNELLFVRKIALFLGSQPSIGPAGGRRVGSDFANKACSGWMVKRGKVWMVGKRQSKAVVIFRSLIAPDHEL